LHDTLFHPVIPAKAGIHAAGEHMGSPLHGIDVGADLRDCPYISVIV
jgi:hypothetical protein